MQIYKKVSVLLIPWLFVFLLLETASRLFFDEPKPAKSMFSLAMSMEDPRRIWKYKSDYFQKYSSKEFEISIQTSDGGLRDSYTNPDDGVIRILAIGDSFTFGWGVEEAGRFTEVLEEKLGAGFPDIELDILNAGHWMYTFDQQYVLAKELVEKYKPDIVIQGIYVPHILTIGEHRWEIDSQGDIESIGFVSFENEIIVNDDGSLKRTNRLIENPPLSSRFISKVIQRYYRWRQLKEKPASVLSLYDSSYDVNEYAWMLTEKAIIKTIHLMENMGITYVPFSIPSTIEVSYDEWPDWVRKKSKKRQFNLEYPTTRLMSLFEDNEVKYVDLLPAFRREYNPGLYFPVDPHWTNAGHVLAATHLLPELEQLIRR